MGIHIISPQVFKYFPEEDNFSIVDFYLDLAAENKILGFKADKYSWIDCGKPENLLNAKEFI
jgi:NDP-sugar pyrophosphorylase family protein